MLQKVLVLLSMLICMVYGGNICCLPEQWEGMQGFQTGSLDDQGHTAITLGSVGTSYDATNKRVRLVENIISGGNSQEFTILQLFNQNVQYNIKNQTCTSSRAPAWTENCIPDTATMTGKYRLGLNQSIEVTGYVWTQGNVSIGLDVTDGCVPITQGTQGEVSGVQFMSGTSVLGITVGIKDPSVFDVPAICKHPHVSIDPNPPRRIFGH
ncbi:hypothetical protein ACF0H5_000689 [Mactra antiquata]